MSAPSEISAPTLGDFLTIIVPTYVQGIEFTLNDCKKYTETIKSDKSINLGREGNIYQKEQEYHCSGDHNLDLNGDQGIEVFEFNEYVPGYKLLTQRTQDHIFSKCMMAYFPVLDENGMVPAIDVDSEPTEPTELQKEVNNICQSGLVDWLRYCVMSHPDVETVMKPIADRYQEAMLKEIHRLDAIPHVEQKTEEWHAIRKNMVSASVAGYMDSEACGCNPSHERSKMEEKSGVKASRPFSWGCAPLRHGQQYEDVSGHVYDTFNRLDSKEYGILPDYRYNWLGASPDGIITKVIAPETSTNSAKHAYAQQSSIDPDTLELGSNSKGYLDRGYIGRMREIKNPVSRNINDQIPSYYYWQMQQQMYVCQLPVCDFIQTLIKHPEGCDWPTYIADTMPYSTLTNATNWLEFQKILSPYIFENIDWPIMNLFLCKKYKLATITDVPLSNADTMLTQTLATRFKDVTHIAPENVNRRGQVKGILWCFTREDDAGETEFKVEFTSIDKAANDEDSIYQHECMLKDKYRNNGGFTLSETHYWNMEEYKVIEVEYNQGLYEGIARYCQRPGTTSDDWHKDDCIISRLRHKWDIVQELRAIDNMDAKRAKFEEYYTPTKKQSKTAAAGGASGKTAYGNPKYQRRKKSDQPRIKSAFNLD